MWTRRGIAHRENVKLVYAAKNLHKYSIHMWMWLEEQGPNIFCVFFRTLICWRSDNGSWKKLLKANARIYSNRNEFYAAVMTILMLIEQQRQQSNIIFFDNSAPQAASRWTLYGKMGTNTRRPPSTHIPNKLEWNAKDIFIASSHSLHSTIVALVSAIKFNIYLVLESALFSPPILSLQSNIRTSQLCGILHDFTRWVMQAKNISAQ